MTKTLIAYLAATLLLCLVRPAIADDSPATLVASAAKIAKDLPRPDLVLACVDKVRNTDPRLKGKSPEQLGRELMKDPGGLALEWVTPLLNNVKWQVEFQKVVQEGLYLQANSNPSVPSDYLVDRFADRLERFAAADPLLNCGKGFIRPVLNRLKPVVKRAVADGQKLVNDLWATELGRTSKRIIDKMTRLVVALDVPGEVEAVLPAVAHKYYLDLDRVKRASMATSTFAQALTRPEEAMKAKGNLIPLLEPKTKNLELEKIVLLVAAEITRRRAREWINRDTCGDFKLGELSWDNVKADPDKVVDKFIMKGLERSLPGGGCILDFVLRPIEIVFDKLQTGADSVCSLAPFAGTSMCTTVVGVVQKAMRYVVLKGIKSGTKEISGLAVDIAVDRVEHELTNGPTGQRLDKVKSDAMKKELVKSADALIKPLKEEVQNKLKKKLSSDVTRYVALLEGHNLALRSLVETAAKLASTKPGTVNPGGTKPVGPKLP